MKSIDIVDQGFLKIGSGQRTLEREHMSHVVT
jgi:hypothetical protein